MTAVLTDVNIQAVSLAIRSPPSPPAGYAGADLIERLISRILPQPDKTMNGTVLPSARVEEVSGVRMKP